MIHSSSVLNTLQLVSTGAATATTTSTTAASLLAVTVVGVAAAIGRRPAVQLGFAHTALMLARLPLGHAVLVKHVSTRCHALRRSFQQLVADATLILRWPCSDH